MNRRAVRAMLATLALAAALAANALGGSPVGPRPGRHGHG